MLLAQQAVEMAKEALRAFLAVGDEADGLAFERIEPRRKLAGRRRLLRRGVEDTERQGLPLLFLRRLAVDASADRNGDAMALVAEPWWDDRAEAAGGSARGHDQELVRRFHRRIDAVAAAAEHGALAALGPPAA